MAFYVGVWFYPAGLNHHLFSQKYFIDLYFLLLRSPTHPSATTWRVGAGARWRRVAPARHGEPNTKCSGGTAPCPSMLHLVLWWQNQLLVATTVAHSPSPSPPSTSPYLSCSSLQPSSEQGSLNTLWSPCASWLPKIAKMTTLHKIAVTHRATCKTGGWLWIKFVD